MKKRSLFISILLALGMLLILSLVTPIPVIADNNNRGREPLRSITNYSLVAQFGIFDNHGRLLVWKAILTGDIDGVELWWMEQPGPPGEVHEDYSVGFYVSRWEIYDEDPLPPNAAGDSLGSNPNAKLLLAGRSAGETVPPPEQDGIWDGRGKVTKTSREFKRLKGRSLYEGGPVIWDPFPYHGVGKIRLEGKGYHDDEDNYGDDHEKSVAGATVAGSIPEGYTLYQNHPNPFNPSTTISFAIPEAGEMKLEIYNLLGQRIRTLISGTIAAGQHSVVWDGTDSGGDKIASGIYLYKLETKDFAVAKRLLLMK